MNNFFAILKSRNEPLFYFGLICLSSAVLMMLIAKYSEVQINGVNTWYKPVKFALSIGTFCWTMGWYTGYLEMPTQVRIYSWATIVLLGFELLYITFQAARGQLSHYNVSSTLYTSLTIAMALAAIGATLYTGYIGILFCTGTFAQLPDYYLWAIRIGIFLFVIFAFEGAIIGANGSHSFGGSGDANGLPLLNWSRKHGDLRVAHFVGMHALQVLPLIAYYLVKDIKIVIVLGVIYGFLALFCLVQALNSKPLISF